MMTTRTSDHDNDDDNNEAWVSPDLHLTTIMRQVLPGAGRASDFGGVQAHRGARADEHGVGAGERRNSDDCTRDDHVVMTTPGMTTS
jgi:hypothetical protein